jgi:hypothetical protein
LPFPLLPFAGGAGVGSLGGVVTETTGLFCLLCPGGSFFVGPPFLATLDGERVGDGPLFEDGGIDEAEALPLSDLGVLFAAPGALSELVTDTGGGSVAAASGAGAGAGGVLTGGA